MKTILIALAVSLLTMGAAFFYGVAAWFAAWGCVFAFACAYDMGRRAE